MQYSPGDYVKERVVTNINKSTRTEETLQKPSHAAVKQWFRAILSIKENRINDVRSQPWERSKFLGTLGQRATSALYRYRKFSECCCSPLP
ncbi:hypothetical protein GCM10011533_01870 [Streptosporangium jomthongense]|nr:hypothetical protein GCM10011533_01870 [Streptosporangium jomthongense]